MLWAEGVDTSTTGHSSIGFTVRHAMVTKVRGEFTDFDASVTIAEDPSESSASGTVRTASVDTRNADRDAHVRGEDFFAVEQYPEMTFTATSFDVDAQGNGTVTGDLTIKSTTKPVQRVRHRLPGAAELRRHAGQREGRHRDRGLRDQAVAYPRAPRRIAQYTELLC